MTTVKVTGISFSPTGNTEKVTEAICAEVAEDLKIPAEHLDLTLPAAREKM